jgi:hypothetical protein
MKKIITLLSLCIASSIVSAQHEEDTTVVKYRGKIITITTDTTYCKNESKKKDSTEKEFNYWKGLEFGFNGYFMDDQYGFNNNSDYNYMELNFGKSFQFNLNIAEFNKGIIGEHVRFMTGLGFRFNRYAFKNASYTLTQNETEIFAIKDSLRDFYKNYLNTSYLTIPAYLTFVTNKDPEHSFHLSIGVVGSVRLGSRTKQRFVMNGEKEKEIKRDTYHLNPFMLDYSMRIGYGDFTAYANYSITQLFEKNKGPEFYPFSFGVSMNF